MHARDLDTLCARLALADQAAGIARTPGQRRADILAMLPGIALNGWPDNPPLTTSPTADPTSSPTSPGARAKEPAGRSGPTPPGPWLPGAFPAGGPPPGVTMIVHVPMATALGLSGEPGEILGRGEVSAATIRRLLPDATLQRLLVDARTGQPLHLDPQLHPPDRGTQDRKPGRRRPPDLTDPPDLTLPKDSDAASAAPGVLLGWLGLGRDGQVADADALAPLIVTPGAVARPTDPARTGPLPSQPGRPCEVWLHDPAEPRHDPSAALTRFLRLRDPLCTGPGCSTPAARCDLDHQQPWGPAPGEQGPGTTASNLGPNEPTLPPRQDPPTRPTRTRGPPNARTTAAPAGPAPSDAPTPAPPTGTHHPPRPGHRRESGSPHDRRRGSSR